MGREEVNALSKGALVRWRTSVPAGADAGTQFPLGSIPEGQMLCGVTVSYYGGDAGQRIGIDLVPAGNSIAANGTVDAEAGTLGWIYPLNGATGTPSTPIPLAYQLVPRITPGPFTLVAATTLSPTTAWTVDVMGYLQDL
jgi:hypothetical protein